MGTSAGATKVAVVGVGHLGRHHARLLHQVPEAELVAVVDAREDVARAVAEPLGVAALTSWEQLPDDVRAVSVAVPTSVHHEVACPLLERGVHVLVEKPMAATLEQARRMDEAARKRDVVLQVGHIERFNPALGVVRDLGVHPRFIEAHRLAPFNFRSLDVSVVMDLMIHDIDIVMDLAGSPIERIDAVGSRVLGRHIDIANARFTFGNGCVANVTASRISFEPLRRTRLFTEDTFVSMDFGDRRAFVVKLAEGFDPGSLDAAAADRLPLRETFREFVQQGLMDLQQIDMDEANPLLSELSAFVQAARGGPATGVSAAEGMRALEVALQVCEQIEQRAGNPA